MTTAVPTRFRDDELATIDWLVTVGVGANRSEVIRRSVAHMRRSIEREQAGERIAASYRDRPQTPQDDAAALANALGMTDAEPW